jgi:hypothetical protein
MIHSACCPDGLVKCGRDDSQKFGPILMLYVGQLVMKTKDINVTKGYQIYTGVCK